MVDANHVFCEQGAVPRVNTIYNLTTLAAWTGSTSSFSLGAAAAGQVVFANDHRLYAETYTLP